MNSGNIEEVINFVEEMSSDKHICLVCDAEEELNNILVSYFEKGLTNNEVCLWGLLGPRQVGDVRKALKSKIPDLDIYIEKEQMILMDAGEIYKEGNTFVPERIVQFWEEKERQVLDKGFKGLRISGSGNWARGKQWIELAKYEDLVNDLIQKKEIKAICTYSSKIADLPELLSVGVHHSRVIVHMENKWQILDAANAKALLKKLEKPYLPD